MDEHIDAPEPRQQAPSNAPPPIPPSGDPTPTTPAADPEQSKKSEKISKSDKIMLIATGFIALGTLVSAGAICFQWREMVRGGADTGALVGYAQRQADDADKMKASAEGFATSAAGINTKLDTAVGKLNDQAGAMKDLAGEAKTQAQEAKIAAAAANSAANTAKDALHVSQRAYISLGAAHFDYAGKRIDFPVINQGHIPSGIASFTIQEATVPSIEGAVANGVVPIEANWHHDVIDSISEGRPYKGFIGIPKVVEASVNNGLQVVVISGIVKYNDGFPDNPERTWTFCSQTMYERPRKTADFGPCDPSVWIPLMMGWDDYPQGETKP